MLQRCRGTHYQCSALLNTIRLALIICIDQLFLQSNILKALNYVHVDWFNNLGRI